MGEGLQALQDELKEVCVLKEDLLAVPPLKQVENQPLDFLAKKSIRAWLSEACALAEAIRSSRPRVKDRKSGERLQRINDLAKDLVPLVRTFKDSLKTLLETLKTSVPNDASLSGAPSSLVFVMAPYGQQINVGSLMANAFNHWRALENPLFLLFLRLETNLNEVWNFGNLYEEASKKTNEIKNLLAKIRGHEEGAKESSESARQNLDKAQSFLKKVEEVSREAETLRKDLREWSQELKEIKERTEKTEDELESLLQQISEEKEKAKSLTKNLEALQNKTELLHQNVEDILKKAQTMLGYATAEGLSEAFKQSREHYQQQFDKSARTLYVSALIIFVLSFLTIGGYLFDLSWLPWLGTFFRHMGGESSGQEVTFTGLLGRAVLILPLLLVLLLQVQTYRTSFALQQAYRHRETITKALPSFQELSPNHRDEFLYQVFRTAHNNPLPEPDNRLIRKNFGKNEEMEGGEHEQKEGE